ncbi:RNA polymerase alpha subunit C-terminal domain-containing protein [Negadavirga shengliensis]|uniref:RNA polymerase alpha subunit C-terminal domain-containing protein n=1 Tax=Negadavirga shengliensis TaxID=1389218 RepID=A0ABV9T2P7_9BACT
MVTLRACPKGHRYYKSSDCPTCPACEQERKPKEGFLSLLAAPARRALENMGIYSLEKLAEYREAEIIRLHGMGPSTLPKLRKALAENGLAFRNDDYLGKGDECAQIFGQKRGGSL